jgi:hypothetical protein
MQPGGQGRPVVLTETRFRELVRDHDRQDIQSSERGRPAAKDKILRYVRPPFPARAHECRSGRSAPCGRLAFDGLVPYSRPASVAAVMACHSNRTTATAHNSCVATHPAPANATTPTTLAVTRNGRLRSAA